MDVRALAFALSLSLLTGLLFGILPAWRFSSGDLQEALKAGSRTLTEGRRGGRLRRLLVAAEVGLSALCLVAAGLLLHSFVRLMQVDQGFNMERVLTADLSLRGESYAKDPERARFYKQALENIRALPGTVAVGIANNLPLRGIGSNNLLLAEGSKVPLLERPLADFRYVNPDYFTTLGIPLISGRVFSDSDGDRLLAVVSARVASRLWPGQDALGKRFHLGDEKSPLLEVIGIVGDVRGYGPEHEAGLAVYTPYWQKNRAQMSLAVRTTMDPHSSAAAIRREIQKLDSEVPLADVRTLRELMSKATAERRFQLSLVGLFAAAALLLAAMGIYGVVAYTMAQRRNEIGIRLALGAAPREMRWMLLGQGMAPVLAGLAAGMAAAFALGRWMQSLLFGVGVTDPWTYGAVAFLLAGIAALACLGPALNAGRTDPAITLRYE
jgi:putative ABC transport system permease protein